MRAIGSRVDERPRALARAGRGAGVGVRVDARETSCLHADFDAMGFAVLYPSYGPA